MSDNNLYEWSIKDAKTWPYFPIIMPLNKDGDGPCSDEECVRITFEVWDRFCNSYGSFDYQPEAINKAIELSLKEQHEPSEIYQGFKIVCKDLLNG